MNRTVFQTVGKVARNLSHQLLQRKFSSPFLVKQSPIKLTVSRGFHISIPKLNKNEQPTPDQSQQEQETSDRKDVVKLDYDEYDDYEPKTAGQKVIYFLFHW
jgi:hypothetical protein